MTSLMRRSLLVAAGTVTGGLAARKLLAPAARAAPTLQPISALRAIVPPVVLPAIRFADAGGASRSLEDYRGHGLLLNIWATWCPPCVAEMPALDALAARLAASRIQVLPVSVDHGGAAAVRAFYAAHGITHLPVLLDPDSGILGTLSLPGIPVTFVIDRAGAARAVLEGSADWNSAAAVARIRALAA